MVIRQKWKWLENSQTHWHKCKNIHEKDKTKVSIGIIDEKNRERFIQSTDANLWHGFEIKESGVYKAYIENDGSEEIEISGYYALNPYVTLEEKEKNEENDQHDNYGCDYDSTYTK